MLPDGGPKLRSRRSTIPGLTGSWEKPGQEAGRVVRVGRDRDDHDYDHGSLHTCGHAMAVAFNQKILKHTGTLLVIEILGNDFAAAVVTVAQMLKPGQ